MKVSALLLSVAGTTLLMSCAGVSLEQNSPPSTHTVDLYWAPSQSEDVAGYNVYRAVYSGECGSFSKINSALITNTRYTDSEVTNGAAYCYAATAVSTGNQESDYSNIALDVKIPAS